MKKKEEATPSVNGLSLEQKIVFTMTDEEMKSFYLKQATFLFPGCCTPSRSEYEILCTLQTEQKRFLSFLSELNRIPWDEAISNVYAVASHYMMQSEMTLKERKEINKPIAEHLKSLSFLLANRVPMGKLQSIYSRHYENVTRLIKSLEYSRTPVLKAESSSPSEATEK